MQRLIDLFQQLVTIDSPSLEERKMCDFLTGRLRDLGFETYEDNAGELLGGNSGNLLGTHKGDGKRSSILLSAHMDTVQPGNDKRAVFAEEDKIVSEGETILGADDLSGIAAILEAITRLQEQNIPFRPVEVLFPVAEESYCLGSRVFDYERVQSREAYTFDLTGAIGTAALAAPTLLSFVIHVTGKASHAGFAPLEGCSAVKAAALAIAKLPIGEPQPGLTLNVGRVEGGGATNIVPPLCKFTGEIRSLSHEAVMKLWDEVQQICTAEIIGYGAHIEISFEIEVTAYETDKHDKVVTRFVQACEELELTPSLTTTLGGSDQNNFALHGITGIVCASSMYEVHSTREYTRPSEMEQCVNIIMKLLTSD